MTGPINWLSQIAAVTQFSFLTLTQRKGSSAAAIFGIAGVVAVMVAVLSIAEGILQTMESSASPENVVVMRSGSNSEMMSILAGDDVRIISEGPGLARNEHGAISSPELFVIINLLMRSTGTDANVPLRGIGRNATQVREQFRIVDGRMFEWGLNEVIVGVGAQQEFSGLSRSELDLDALLDPGAGIRLVDPGLVLACIAIHVGGGTEQDEYPAAIAESAGRRLAGESLIRLLDSLPELDLVLVHRSVRGRVTLRPEILDEGDPGTLIFQFLVRLDFTFEHQPFDRPLDPVLVGSLVLIGDLGRQ